MIIEALASWLIKLPALSNYEAQVVSVLLVLEIFAIAALSYFLAKRVLVKSINRAINKSKTELDDVLLKHRVFNRAAYLLPALLIYRLLPSALSDYPGLSAFITLIVSLYFIFAATSLLNSLIDSALDIYHSSKISNQVPIQGIAQAAKLLLYFIALIVAASLLVGESPLQLFAGLGAMTAVLMLVFKDPILGFAAGLQISYNRLAAVGDWVEIPQHKADGDIMEIGLTTVKVRNFDNTITTVPTQSLTNDSFKNWRGMQESAGRRIKRTLYMDVNSIQFCNESLLARFSKIDYIKEYIEIRRQDIARHNQENAVDPVSMANGRRLTNIGTFRAYILAYLKRHPQINQNLTLLVRQLPATDSGLPIEVYAFSAEKNWAKYEAIQADIFDHLFAVAKEFDLRIFQQPSGADFQCLGKSS